jgi:predicted RNA-binding protein with RPS1 domain
LKVDPTRLRLGSYQRELPEAMLMECLNDAVASSLASHGVDLWHASGETLTRLPGMRKEVADAIIKIRNEQGLVSRQALLEQLKGIWSEAEARQSVGLMRIFESSETLDGTCIHPEDYRLAHRLIANSDLPAPPAAPPGWKKPKPVEPAAKPDSDTEAVADATSSPPSDAESVAGPTSEATAETENPGSSVEVASELPVPSEAAVTEPSPTDLEAPSSRAGAQQTLPSELDSLAPSPNENEIAEAPAAQADCAGTNAAAALWLASSAEKFPDLTIDVEKLARGWQVGREKLKKIAKILQRPFVDSRAQRCSIPLLTSVPSLDELKPGMTAWAVIIGVADFGAFADLGPDCSGLVHVSRLSNDYIVDPHQIVQVGDLIQVWVVDIDTGRRRVSLTAIEPGTEIVHEPQAAQGRPTHSDSRGRGGQAPSSENRDGRGPAKAKGRFEDSRPEGQRSDGDRRPAARKAATGSGRKDAKSGDRGQESRDQDSRGQDSRGQDSRGQRKHTRHDAGRPRDRSDGENAASERIAKPKIAKPITPITDAMQQGKEPMRSFSDLLQFMQVKRDDGPGDVEPAQSSDSGNAASSESGETTSLHAQED